MGEEVGAASASSGSRPGSSTAKTRDAAKKRAALWKKQTKSFKLKDVGKKVDAVRFCAQDERYFREQAEVLPLVMGFLSRTKVRIGAISARRLGLVNLLRIATPRRPLSLSWRR
jgi:hypothetical protein